MKQNIELKARLCDLAKARQVAAGMTSSPAQILRQVDTYFACAQGRLKLREFADSRAELIAYDRPDQAGAKTSAYRILPFADGRPIKELLSAALGVLVVVEKTRELYLRDNVRIHLDQVTGLGAFLEIEAVLISSAETEQGHRQVDDLAIAFELAPADLISRSYSDLLLDKLNG